MPELGENVHSGTIVNILVAVGDTIDPNQPLVEMETDKATVEVPSPVGGVVKAIHLKVGDTAQVGQTILTVETTTPVAEPAAPAPSRAHNLSLSSLKKKLLLPRWK